MFTFRKITTKDKDLAQVQDNVGQVFATLSLVQPLDGTLIKDIVFSSAALTQSVTHKLGRQPLGWFIADVTSGVTIYRTGWDARYLTLTSSAPATASLWVF